MQTAANSDRGAHNRETTAASWWAATRGSLLAESHLDQPQRLGAGWVATRATRIPNVPLIRVPPRGSVVFARCRAAGAEAACPTRCRHLRLAGRRGDPFASLPQRRRQRAAGKACNQRIRQPAQRDRYVAGQANGFEFHIDSAIALLVPGDALQPPDETVTPVSYTHLRAHETRHD